MMRPPPKYTLFPYTTLFRSVLIRTGNHEHLVPGHAHVPAEHIGRDAEAGHMTDMAGAGGVRPGHRGRGMTPIRRGHARTPVTAPPRLPPSSLKKNNSRRSTF